MRSSRPGIYISKYLLNQLIMLAYLNQVLPLSLGDKRLELRCCEGIDKAGLRDDEEEDLGAGEYG